MRTNWFFFYVLAAVGALTGCSTFSDTEPRSNPVAYEQRQLQCMAEAIHGEARGESEEGKIFVGRVIITRVKQGYGQNYCSVVYAKRQFAPLKAPSKTALAAARKSKELGPNGITHFHSYKKQKTPLAGFSHSRQCTSRGKVGGHWGFTCPGLRQPASPGLKSASND